MTAETPIPDDIMQASRDALAPWMHNVGHEERVARALMAERAKCEAELASIRASLDAAEARAEKFLWQVRDTCARAEKAEAELATLRAENARLREALVPFAEYPAATDTRLPGDMRVTAGSPMAARQCTVADFRRARAALKGGE